MTEVRIECPIHHVVLENMRCPGCLQANLAKYNQIAEELGGRVSMSFPPDHPTDVLVNGELRRLRHATAYIEWSIPAELEDTINAAISSAIAKYEETCMCADCQKARP